MARAVSGWLGGPMGVHARLGTSRWTPTLVLFCVTTAVFLVGLAQKSPCEAIQWPRGSNAPFVHMCYTDVPYLYRERGFAQGNVAYLDSGDYHRLEYPVLTGAVMQATASLTRLFGSGHAAPDSVLFYEITVVVLFGCALVTVWATRRLAFVPAEASHGRAGPPQDLDRPYDAMMVAAAPALALAGTINWDLLAVALTTLALLAWSRSRPVAAGILIGLGAAAKFYPLLVLGPLLLLAWRTGRLQQGLTSLVAAAAGWFAVNLPVMLVAQESWSEFWAFNQQRAADFGSLWYVLGLAGHPVQHVNAVSLGLFGLACVGIAALTVVAPARPQLVQLVFLTVAAFLLVNKVYSPQYVLWLLPLVALARPRWRDWVVWQAGELIYWGAIWLHIAGQLTAAGEDSDPLYWLAVLIRLGTTAYLCVLVVRDILHAQPAPPGARRALHRGEAAPGWTDAGAPETPPVSPGRPGRRRRVAPRPDLP